MAASAPPRPRSLAPGPGPAAASPATPSTRRVRSRPPAGTGVGSYAIGLLLIVATTLAILQGGWIGNANPALLVGVVAVLEAALLGLTGAGRLVALLLVPPLYAAIVVPTTILLLPASISHLGWYHALGEYVLQALVGLLATGPPPFFAWAFHVGLASIVWYCGYWLGWMAFRERRGVLAVLPIMVVLAVNSLNAPSIDRTSGPGSGVGLAETLAVLAALIVIGLSELGRLATAWRRRRVPTMDSFRPRFTTSLVVGSVVILAVSLILPPLTTTSVADLFGGLPGPGNGSTVGPGTSIIGFSTVVAPGGPLVNQPQRVFTYSTGNGRPAYLGSVQDSVFQAGNWMPASGSRTYLVTPQALRAGSPIPRDPAALGGSRSDQTVSLTYAGSPSDATTDTYVPFAGDPVSVSRGAEAYGLQAPSTGPSGAPPTPSPAPPPGSLTLLPTNAGCVYAGDGLSLGNLTCSQDFLNVEEVLLTSPRNYATLGSTGSVSDATVQQLEGAGTDYPSWLVSAFAAPLVSQPAPAADQVAASYIHSVAVQWTQGTTNPYDAAAAIESHLRNTGVFSYTLDPTAPPSGTWPIVYFLQTSHAGYCQYFASAMGALLRSLGIPTVLVSGFGPGTASGRTSTGTPTFSVSTTDAHVWVEAYFPGYGWIPFEPTPASAYGVYLPFARGGATAPNPGDAQPTTAPKGGLHPTPPPGRGSSRTATTAGGGAWWVVAVSAIGAVLALGVTALALSLAWWRRPGSLAGAWRRLTLAGRLSGIRRDAAETRSAYARRLAVALGGGGPPALAPELGTVAAVSGKAEFSPHGLEPDDRAAWLAGWRVISRDVPPALRRRLLRRQPRG